MAQGLMHGTERDAWHRDGRMAQGWHTVWCSWLREHLGRATGLSQHKARVQGVKRGALLLLSSAPLAPLSTWEQLWQWASWL